MSSNINICHPRTESTPVCQLCHMIPASVAGSHRLPPAGSFESAAQDSNTELQSVGSSQVLIFNPLPLLWPDRRRTFGELVEDFFRRKGS
jgi:hypothetical protein